MPAYDPHFVQRSSSSEDLADGPPSDLIAAMPGRPFSKRVPAEDSDTESEHDDQAANHARDDALRRLQEMDLGTHRAGKLKQDDRRQKHEDRANVKHLLDTRDACQRGTEAHSLYTKNKSATAAWNNPNNVADNHEEQFDTLDGGNAHRQRMRNEHGGRVEEPNDWEAGYAGGGRGRGRGGFAPRGGRGGMAPAPSRAPAPAGSRAGIASRLSPYSARPTPTQPAKYRPLDPALEDANDPRSKYGRAPTRGSAPVGRGGSSAGRASGRAEFNARMAPTPAPGPARVYRPSSKENHIDMLADPAAFMRAVDRMKVKTKTDTKPESASTLKAAPKSSSTNIESKWGDIGSAGHKPSTTITQLPATAISTANIKQVPTSEFVLPHPHRGETDSWTDGLPSERPSDSVSPASYGHANEPSPDADQDDLIGLGIQGLDTLMGGATKNGNTADGVDLMDVTEDLTVLQEPPKPRAALATRILVNGAWYILDESALGNVFSTKVVNSSPASSFEPTLPQGEWTSPTNNTIKDFKHKKATSTTSGSSSIIDNRNVNVAAQTTPSLTNSGWATVAPPCVANPFATGTAPTRPNMAQVQSPGGAESMTSTPNLASSIWGHAGAQVATSQLPQVQPSSTPTVTPTSHAVDRDVMMGGATANAGRAAEPAVIDGYDLVRLQAVGNAGFGMTPFRPTPVTPGESTPRAAARPTHTRQQSIATSVNSDATGSTARARGLTASKYASGDAASASTEHLGLSALQAISLNSSAPLRGGKSVPKPSPSRSTFGHARNVSRYAIHHDENTPPLQLTSTSSFGSRPILRPTTRVPQASIVSPARGRAYNPTRTTRRSAGAGFAVMQADIAAAAALAANTTAPSSTGGLFPSTTSTTPFGPTVTDDGYESEL